MNIRNSIRSLFAFIFLLFAPTVFASGPDTNLFSSPQSGGTAGVITGVVTDPSGAVVPNVAVTISNPVSRFEASTTSDALGVFRFRNVPFNRYHFAVSESAFAPFETDLEVNSSVPIDLPVQLQLKGSNTEVTVEGSSEDLMENNPTAHTDLDQALLSKLPVHSVSSPLSSAITLATPGVTADSNGLFHPLGEHADTSFSIDNQPITDQQSKVFSNQIPMDSIQSMEVISGVPPAEYGDKNSLVVRVVTRSGLGEKRPRGSITAQYGSFGTAGGALNFANGGDTRGNYISLGGLNSGRFLDSPEFLPLHDHGNSQSFFDRFDYNPNQKDSLHLNLTASRSWFQAPNTYDQQAVGQDQRQLIRTFNISPGWTHLFNQSLLLTATAFVRQDRVGYYPTADRYSDQPATLAQQRRLTNAGAKVDLSYVKGIHNVKVGVQFSHTFLSEDFRLGLTDPAYNAVCLDSAGAPVTAPTPVDPAHCVAAGYVPNADFQSALLPYDLTRAGQLFQFRGHADIKQEAIYAQDAMTIGNWSVNLGVRGDNYNGLTHGAALQPRAAMSYNVKKTHTVLRGSYGHLFETPYNENLVLSSSTGIGGLASGSFGDQPIEPGRRNQFTIGVQQGFGRFVVVDAEYFWKFTKNAYDFDTLFNTPLTFPIAWRKSKIDGASVRISMPLYHGVTAFTVMGTSRARFFGPEVGGILFNSPIDASVFRIDHDQRFSQTTSVQYQPFKRGPWAGFTWRYDSGLVAGDVPDLQSALALTADQQAAIGFYCGNIYATFTNRITSCSTDYGASRLVIPAEGTANPDSNPPRIAPRHLFDLSGGMDNIFHTERYTWDARFTVINLTNHVALYNFLSTFSGTHFVPPRSYTAELTMRF